MASLIIPSRFSALKVEDDQSSDEVTQTNGKNAPVAKKKNKKKKKAKSDLDQELAHLAFGIPLVKSEKTAHGNSVGNKKPNQWQDWKHHDDQFVSEEYEKQLAEALLQSKLDLEKKKDVDDVVNANKSKKKRKEKQMPMSLDEFNHLSSEGGASGDRSATGAPSKANSVEDREFFDVVSKDVQKAVKKEKIQESFVKNYMVETGKTQEYQHAIEQRDCEISELKAANKRLEEEIEQVKKRNKQLCFILGQGEMKDKKDILMDLEQMTRVQTEQAKELEIVTAELEKERSTAHKLRAEVDRLSAVSATAPVTTITQPPTSHAKSSADRYHSTKKHK